MMDEKEEEVFMRPIQKCDIINLLKKYNLLDDKNLKPLEQLKDTDIIDIDLAAFYWNLFINKNTNILGSCETLEKVQWSELIEPENDDQFEEFENTLMLLDDTLVATSWEKASLKIFEDYAKIILNDKEYREEIGKNVLNECFTESNDSEETERGGLNSILMENQENKMKQVLDLDKRIKDLKEELGDEQKKKKKNERISLDANSILNDTLEEVEVLMKCGESYMTRQSIINKSNMKSLVRSKSEDSIFERNDADPVPKYAERSSKTPQLKKQKQKWTPSTPSCSSKCFNNDAEFKIPKSRAPRKLPIQSPIGDYIKNSPTTPLIKKVVSTPLTGPVKLLENYREVLQENTNTPLKLPTKTYKPAARNLFVEKENQPKIPKNIQKLYTTPVPQIIKHLGRVPSDKLPTSTSNSDFENNADLTILEETKNSEENSMCSNDETRKEVSLYVSKQPLHSNTLQQTNCK